MDIVAHALWTNVAFIKNRKRWLAVLFGILPDILSFGPVFAYVILMGIKNWTEGFKVKWLLDYTTFTYGITHSLLVFAVAYLIIYLMTKKKNVFLFGWLLHIIIDIPTHSKDFYPTPYLYPFKSPPVNGISWGHPVFMIVNYSALILVYGFLTYKYFKNYKKVKTKNIKNTS